VFRNTHVNEGKRNSKNLQKQKDGNICDVSVYDIPLILVTFLCNHEIQPYFMKEITRVGYDFQSLSLKSH